MENERIVIVKKQATSEELQFLEDQIYEFNSLATNRDDGLSFSRFIYGEDNSIVAGLTGWTWAQACEIENLWVHRNCRGMGYGKRLLESAEEEARLQECHIILISSYTFQAPIFYQKYGYSLEWELADFPPGHRHCYLVKRMGIPAQ